MESHPPGSPIPDPLLAAVRRRHPDVDVVVLPPEGAQDVAEPVDDARVEQARAVVAETAATLWAAVAPLSEQHPETRLGFADREADVRAVARVVEKRSDGYAVLVRLRHELEQRGWTVRRPPARPDAGVERLVAAREGSRLTASCAPDSGAVLLEVASTPLPVGVERARELVR